jgi:hypothetical protein
MLNINTKGMIARILKYKSLFIKDLFTLDSNEKCDLTIVPSRFNLSTKIKPNIPADLYMVGVDRKEEEFGTGLRILKHNLFYGDRMEKNRQRSLMILHKINEKEIELHFFYGFYPETRKSRSSFFADYFNELDID